jgi:hypothetical protein
MSAQLPFRRTRPRRDALRRLFDFVHQMAGDGGVDFRRLKEADRRSPATSAIAAMSATVVFEADLAKSRLRWR